LKGLVGFGAFVVYFLLTVPEDFFTEATPFAAAESPGPPRRLKSSASEPVRHPILVQTFSVTV
jgi:hypothetical protein